MLLNESLGSFLLLRRVCCNKWKLNKPGICGKCEGKMSEICQLSYHLSLSFALFYFAALPNPPHSGCPVNVCKYNTELSRKEKNTKSDLAWQQGEYCCGSCNSSWWAASVSLNLTSPSGGDPGQRWLQQALKGMVMVANIWLDSDFCPVHPGTFSVFPNKAQEGYGGEEIAALWESVSLPGLWIGTVAPLLKEQCEDAFVGRGFSKLLLVLPVAWATLRPEVRSAKVTQTQPVCSCQLPPNTDCFFKMYHLEKKKKQTQLLKSPYICIQR